MDAAARIQFALLFSEPTELRHELRDLPGSSFLVMTAESYRAGIQFLIGLLETARQISQRVKAAA
jgi:hypothetical protein